VANGCQVGSRMEEGERTACNPCRPIDYLVLDDLEEPNIESSCVCRKDESG